jgi:uncharacterized protein YjlB
MQSTQIPQNQQIPAPDFVEHVRQRMGVTRREAELKLIDWVSSYKGTGRGPGR